jgi:hypothetical protein
MEMSRRRAPKCTCSVRSGLAIARVQQSSFGAAQVPFCDGVGVDVIICGGGGGGGIGVVVGGGDSGGGGVVVVVVVVVAAAGSVVVSVLLVEVLKDSPLLLWLPLRLVVGTITGSGQASD